MSVNSRAENGAPSRRIMTDFGEMEVTQSDIIHFDEGILGFEDIKDYVLISHDEHGSIMTLQYADGVVPQFVVLDPFVVKADYTPVLPATASKLLGEPLGKLTYLVIAVIKENYLETVVNMKSPIVINTQTNKAAQVIVENDDYSMRQRVFDNGGAQ